MRKSNHAHQNESPLRFIEDFMSPRQIRRLEKKAERQLRGEQQLAKEAIQQYERSKFQLFPKTQFQSELLYGLRNYPQVVAFGPAGTGKTYVISAHAAMQYIKGDIDKIVITRPNVATGRTLGLFPGSLEEKMMVWVMPVVAVLKEILGEEMFTCALKNRNIVLQPIETIRGASFENAFVIVDEAQNINIDEIKAIVTRMGENSTLVLNGDNAQKDIREDSGLAYVLNCLRKSKTLAEMTYICEADSDDIVRSALVKAWVKLFEDY